MRIIIKSVGSKCLGESVLYALRREEEQFLIKLFDGLGEGKRLKTANSFFSSASACLFPS
jgi:hypothetical protein